MRVASDTAPLSTLAQMGWLDWLRQRWGEVIAPEAVWAELGKMKDPVTTAALDSARHDGWLRILPASNVRLTNSLLEEIDPGEAETIALALEIGAEFVMIDDRVARESAKRHGLRLAGTMSMVIWAKRQGIIPSARDAALLVRQRTRFFLSDDFIEEIAHEAGEPGLLDEIKKLMPGPHREGADG